MCSVYCACMCGYAHTQGWRKLIGKRYVANPTPAPWSAPGQQATDVPKVALRWGRGGAGRKGTRPWQKIIVGDSAGTYFAFWQGVSSCPLSFQFVSKNAKYHASMKPCTFLLAGSEWKFKVEKEEERKGNKARRKKERKTEIYFILETDGHFDKTIITIGNSNK